MKRSMAVVAMVLALTMASIAWGTPLNINGANLKSVPAGCIQYTHVTPFMKFSAKVWNLDRWQRDRVKHVTILAQRHYLHCAKPKDRRQMQKIWQTDKSSFHAYRAIMVWEAKYRSFEYPDGSHWAVPYPIAICESGENYYASPSGAYGEIPPLPQNQPPKVQDEIAYRLYKEHGEGPWKEYEGKCPLRH